MAGPDPEEEVLWPATLQQWRAMTFFHWAYPPEQVRPLVPPDFELDLRDGAAWVSLTAFRMVDFRLGTLPPAGRLSTFPETNVRTYVRGPDGRDGLWFLTLEAARLPLVLAASALYGVPYRWADMSVESTTVDGRQTIRYRSRRRGAPTVGHDLVVRPGPPCPPTSPGLDLDHWLAGRWRAYSTVAGRRVTAAVHHEPWPLCDAEVARQEESLLAAVGLPPPGSPARVRYSPGVHVRLGPPRPVRPLPR